MMMSYVIFNNYSDAVVSCPALCFRSEVLPAADMFELNPFFGIVLNQRG